MIQDIFKMFCTSRTNNRHDVTISEIDGIILNRKINISRTEYDFRESYKFLNRVLKTTFSEIIIF